VWKADLKTLHYREIFRHNPRTTTHDNFLFLLLSSLLEIDSIPPGKSCPQAHITTSSLPPLQLLLIIFLSTYPPSGNSIGRTSESTKNQDDQKKKKADMKGIASKENARNEKEMDIVVSMCERARVSMCVGYISKPSTQPQQQPTSTHQHPDPSPWP